MLKFIMQKLGYGNQLVENEPVPDKEYIPLHSIITNQALLEHVSNNRCFDFNAHAPIHDVLPFTVIEYIVRGFLNYVNGNAVSGAMKDIPASEKFTNKRLINIPHYTMHSLEFLNVLQTAMWELEKDKKFTPYILLKNSDVTLNSVTSFNFSKTALRLSVPLDVLNTLSELSLLCDFNTGDEDLEGLFFQLRFINSKDGWFFDRITSTEMLSRLSPFELFMYAWEAILHDIDHICNRKPIHVLGGGMIDYVHHYNMRAKYDISQALHQLVKIIDEHAKQTDRTEDLVQTIITDNQLSLSSYQSDFKAALYVLKNKGSKREIFL